MAEVAGDLSRDVGPRDATVGGHRCDACARRARGDTGGIGSLVDAREAAIEGAPGPTTPEPTAPEVNPTPAQTGAAGDADAGDVDGETDSATANGGEIDDDGGYGCRTTAGDRGRTSVLLTLLAGLARRRRRRTR